MADEILNGHGNGMADELLTGALRDAVDEMRGAAVPAGLGAAVMNRAAGWTPSGAGTGSRALDKRRIMEWSCAAAAMALTAFVAGAVWQPFAERPTTPITPVAAAISGASNTAMAPTETKESKESPTPDEVVTPLNSLPSGNLTFRIAGDPNGANPDAATVDVQLPPGTPDEILSQLRARRAAQGGKLVQTGENTLTLKGEGGFNGVVVLNGTNGYGGTTTLNPGLQIDATPQDVRTIIITPQAPGQLPLPPEAQAIVAQMEMQEARANAELQARLAVQRRAVVQQLQAMADSNTQAGNAEAAAAIRQQLQRMGEVLMGDAAHPAAAPANLTAYRNRVGQTAFFTVTGADNAPIWGNGIYTDDSPPNVTAVHAGIVKPGQSATVRVTILPGQASYDGGSRNGIDSQAYGAFQGSYKIEAVDGAAIPAPPAPARRMLVPDKLP